MKKYFKVIICFIGLVCAMILILGISFSYITNYKKITIDTSNSPDRKYELTLQAVGEPDWPFGSASGRLVLMESKDKISQTDFELDNDGGSITSSCWKVTWYEDYVEVILSGEEQFDEQVILYFDGTVDMKQLPNTEVAEQENDTSVEYTTKPDSIDLGESNQKNITEQVDKAKKAESWTMDESNGTMYFFLDEQNGWRLVVVDAAAGSRFYVMERTADGGDTWERINEDPFDNQAGVAEGVMFLDDNFGIATPEQAERMVKEHLLNEKTFCAPYGVRTLSKMEKMYAIMKSGNPSCWLGPIWGVSNYMVFDGLCRYGYTEAANDLAEKTITLFGRDLEECGQLHEYYDPESGEGVNNPGFQNWNFLAVKMFSWLKSQEENTITVVGSET